MLQPCAKGTFSPEWEYWRKIEGWLTLCFIRQRYSANERKDLYKNRWPRTLQLVGTSMCLKPLPHANTWKFGWINSFWNIAYNPLWTSGFKFLSTDSPNLDSHTKSYFYGWKLSAVKMKKLSLTFHPWKQHGPFSWKWNRPNDRATSCIERVYPSWRFVPLGTETFSTHMHAPLRKRHCRYFTEWRNRTYLATALRRNSSFHQSPEDYLFVASRMANHALNIPETKNGMKTYEADLCNSSRWGRTESLYRQFPQKAWFFNFHEVHISFRFSSILGLDYLPFNGDNNEMKYGLLF